MELEIYDINYYYAVTTGSMSMVGLLLEYNFDKWEQVYNYTGTARRIFVCIQNCM